MLLGITHTVSRTISYSLRRSLASQSRNLTSSISRNEENAPSKSNPPSSRQPQVYLNTERKRKLISLYHQTAQFVHPDSIDSYIDREFHRVVLGDKHSTEEKDRKKLENDLSERRSKPKTFILTDYMSPKFRTISESTEQKRDDKWEAALFGLDDSKKAGLESVEQARHAKLEKPKEPLE